MTNPPTIEYMKTVLPCASKVRKSVVTLIERDKMIIAAIQGRGIPVSARVRCQTINLDWLLGVMDGAQKDLAAAVAAVPDEQSDNYPVRLAKAGSCYEIFAMIINTIASEVNDVVDSHKELHRFI